MMRVLWSRLARDDLLAITRYIAERNPSRALSFNRELVAAGEERGRFPHSGRRRRDIADNLLTFPFGRYLFVYSIEREHVLVRRVLHGAREINRALREDLGDGDQG